MGILIEVKLNILKSIKKSKIKSRSAPFPIELNVWIHILGCSPRVCDVLCVWIRPHATCSCSLRGSDIKRASAGSKQALVQFNEGFSAATLEFNPPLSAESRTANFDLHCTPPSTVQEQRTGSPVAMETSSLQS